MVAVHVSKVSKDYSPHGYSINSELAVAFADAGGGGADDHTSYALLAQDADLIIEDVTIMDDAGVAGAVAFWEITVGSWDPTAGAPGPTTVTDIAYRDTNSAPGGGGAIVASTPESLTLIGYPVLSAGSVLLVEATPDGSPPALSLTIWVRYRRKA